MGIVIKLTAPGFPARTAGLDQAEALFLQSVRWWVARSRDGDDPLAQLLGDFGRAGLPDAAFSLDALMRVVARTARRRIFIHCPHCPDLADDEANLLHAAGRAQAGDSETAELALRTALLSAQGADFAMGPLEGLGELFRLAGLRFGRRRPPSRAEPFEAWTPSRDPLGEPR